jgi:hypothetical protein
MFRVEKFFPGIDAKRTPQVQYCQLLIKIKHWRGPRNKKMLEFIC